MGSDKTMIRIVGVLFLVQMIAAVLSYSVILEPLLFSENFLANMVADSTAVTMAMILDIICGLSVLGIAVILYPILKKYNERIALWYVGLRLTEIIHFMISGILLLTILAIGREFVAGGGSEPVYLHGLAKYLRAARGNTQDIGLLLYCFGTSTFYYLLFTSRLVPRFLSVWGLVGVTLLCAEILSNIFRTSLGGMMIMMPLGLNEIFLGTWLIIKGFSPLPASTQASVISSTT